MREDDFLKAEAIVYTSNTGFTEQYAKMLGEETGLPVYSLRQSKSALEEGADIIYMGCIMAGSVKGCKDAQKYYNVKAICAVGVGSGEEQAATVRENMKVKSSTALFALPGGLNKARLGFVERIIISIISKAGIKALISQTERTAAQDITLRLLKDGGSAVSREHLAPVIGWYKE